MNTAEDHGGFYQFPLCLLAQPLPFADVLTFSFQYGACHFLDVNKGEEWRNSGPRQREAAFDEARKIVGFNSGDIRLFLDGHARVAQMERHWRTLGRKTCWVRLRKDFYFDTRDKEMLSERDWRVVVAIFSAIGDKDLVKLGWQGIQSRAAGWLTPPQTGAEPCGPLYPRGQIERSAAELVARGFVFVATYRRGERYWTHRYDHAGLWKQIEERKLRHAKAHAQRNRLDRIASAVIHAQLNPGTPAPHPALVKTAQGLPRASQGL